MTFPLIIEDREPEATFTKERGKYGLIFMKNDHGGFSDTITIHKGDPPSWLGLDFEAFFWSDVEDVMFVLMNQSSHYAVYRLDGLLSNNTYAKFQKVYSVR